MTIKTGSVKGRRTLRFESLDDLIREVEFVVSRPAKTLGNWSVAQIVDHMGKAIDASYNGPQLRAPWHVRLILAPLVLPGVLSKSMPAGFSLPARMARFLPDDQPDLQPSLEKLRAWIE